MTIVSVRWAASAAAPPDAAGMLNEAEAERWRRLRRPEDRQMFLAAHVLARHTVSDRTGVPVGDIDLVQRCERCGRPHGRPTSVVTGEAGPAISFSHAGGFVVAAVAERPVGVDLEPLAVPRVDVSDIALSDEERAELDRAPASDRAAMVIRWWVRKEAVLKATGEGMATDPSTLRVTPPWAPAEIIGPSPIAVLHDLDLQPDLAATVAVLGDSPIDVDVSRWRW